MTLIHPLLITLPNFEGFSPNQEEGSTFDLFLDKSTGKFLKLAPGLIFFKGPF